MDELKVLVHLFKKNEDMCSMGMIRLGCIAMVVICCLNHGRAQELTRELEKFSIERQQRIHAFLAKHPNQKIIEGGRLLVDVSPFGTPIYKKSHSNQQAAFTVGADFLKEGGGSFYELEGEGMLIGVWEADVPNSSHQEFGRRVSQRDNPVFAQGDHATHVIGTIAAAGLNPLAKGMSSRVQVDSYDAANDDSELLNAAQKGLLVSSHSYGVLSGWDGGTWYGDAAISPNEDWKFGFYTAETRIWDQIIFNNPQLLICKSAGNDRGDSGPGRPADGPYDCVSDVATAKNILTIGAVSGLSFRYSSPGDVRMSDFSSWGPTDDGRIKPDIVAMGVSVLSTFSQNNGYGVLQGTSMSTPNVSGSLVLLQQMFHRLHGKYMDAATLKGLVLHTAREAGTSNGPDYQFGWGLANIDGAARFIKGVDSVNHILQTRTLEQDQELQIPIHLTSGQKVKVTIIWTDPAGEVSPISLDPTEVKLVNDLNLVVQDDLGNAFFPWVLEPSNPSKAATQGINTRDNIEVVEFIATTTGSHLVSISHIGTLRNQQQNFTLLVTKDGGMNLPTSLRWRSGSTSTDFNDPNNWTVVESGLISSRPPDENTYVSIEATSNLELTGRNIDCRGLYISGNGQLRIRSADTLRIREDIVIRSGLIEFQVPHLLVEGKPVSSIVEGRIKVTKSMTFNSGRWRFSNTFLNADSVFSLSSNIDLNQATWQTNFFRLDAPSRFTSNRSVLLSQGDILLEGTLAKTEGLSIKVDRDISQARVTTSGGVLPLDTLLLTGKVKLMAEVKANVVQLSGDIDISRDISSRQWLIMPSSSVNLGSNRGEIGESITATGVPSQHIVLTGDGARLTSPLNTKHCLDYLQISGVDTGGQAIFNAGVNSTSSNATGWLFKKCDDVLFANMEVRYPCPNGLTSIESRSSGAPDQFAWLVSPGGKTFDQPVNYLSLPLGEYEVSLTVSKNSETHSNRFGFSITNTGSTLRKPVLRREADLIRVIGFSPNFMWLRDGVLIEGQTGNLLRDTSPGKYNVIIFDNTCRFISDTLEIESVVTSIADPLMGSHSDEVAYPNPSHGNFKLKTSTEIFDIRVFNAAGIPIEVGYQKDQNGFVTIQLLDPVKGMYLLQYVDGKISRTIKIVVN
jgi:hypothetical protein